MFGFRFDPYQALKTITYKPESELAIYPHSYFKDVMVLNVRLPVEYDSSNGHKFTEEENGVLNLVICVPDHCMKHRDCFYGFVKAFVVKAEMHEFDEWFRINGKAVSNPHQFGNTIELDYPCPLGDEW